MVDLRKKDGERRGISCFVRAGENGKNIYVPASRLNYYNLNKISFLSFTCIPQV